MQIQLNFPDSERVAAILTLCGRSQSKKYRDGVVAWCDSMSAAQSTGIAIDDDEPYAPGGIVYIAPVLLQDSSSLEQCLRNLVPSTQFVDEPRNGHWSEARPYGTCSVCWTDDFHDIHSMLVELGDGLGVMIETSYISARESAPWHPRRGEPVQLFALVADILRAEKP